jgi:thioredoxin 1
MRKIALRADVYVEKGSNVMPTGSSIDTGRSLENGKRYSERSRRSEQRSSSRPTIDETIEVTDAEFEEVILQSELPVIVSFWSSWCSPSAAIESTLEDLAQRYAGELLVARVNTDLDRDWAIKYCVQATPTLLFVHRGSLLNEHLGAMPESILFELVEEFLNTASENPV